MDVQAAADVLDPEENKDVFENQNSKIDIQATGEALEFLSSVDDSLWNSLLFSDALVTVSQTGKEIGEMKISVEETKWKNEDCYLVHATSSGTVDQVQIGTSVTAYITRTFKTLEQTQHEYVKIEDNPLERRTQIVAEGNYYAVKRTIIEGEEIRKTTSNIPAEGFISEGSNLLLERVFAKNTVPDNMVFVTLDTEAKPCSATYSSLGEITQNIETEEVRVVGIERKIHSTAEDSTTTWQSFYLPNGHLVRRKQLGSQVAMTVLQMPLDQEQKKAESKRVVQVDRQNRRPLKWEEDMQLYSNFLDRKAELEDDHVTYMRRHPELRALLADFLQFLLLKKPDDVCGFASDFFSAFSTASPSMPSYARANITP